jgi:hypothetical protein
MGLQTVQSIVPRHKQHKWWTASVVPMSRIVLARQVLAAVQTAKNTTVLRDPAEM